MFGISRHVTLALSSIALVLGGAAFAPLPTAPTTTAALQDSLEEAQAALERRPDDPELLMRAAVLADDLAYADQALWYAELARLSATDSRQAKEMEKKLKEMRVELGVSVPPIGEAVEVYTKAVFDFAKGCGRQRLYANAADSLGALMGTRYERDARSALDKLFKKSTAVEAMHESGVPVKVEVRARRSSKEIARLDERHSEWDNAYEAKGTNYTVKTNMGVEMADKILGAMEQMNRFYRLIFEHKERGGKMKRCEVRVYKSRQEFDDANPGIGEGVGGYFMPGENSVTTYDPRTATGFMNGPIEELWSTLYHEASHQFTRAVWKLQIPTWLNEGTASYFEGAALLPGGVVETNRIPESRLNSIAAMCGMGPHIFTDKPASEAVLELEYLPSHPGLRSVIAYFQPGSYPGEYYPFGWGLVYFSMNYENEKAERVYEPLYKDFMRSYMGSDKRSPVKRFEDFFINDPGFEGVKTFEDFEKRFNAWILELARIEFGGADQADKLIARAQNQIDHGFHGHAVESLRWALRKRPADPKATHMLAQCYETLENDDAAIFMYRELFDIGRLAPEGDELKNYDGSGTDAKKAAEEGLLRINKTLGSMITEQVPAVVAGAIAEADAWVEAGYPRVALQSLALAGEVIGGDVALTKKRAEIRDEHDVSIQRTRRVAIDDDLEGWSISEKGWTADISGDDSALVHGMDRTSVAYMRQSPPPTYRFEVDVEVNAEERFGPIVGITFADGADVFARIGSRGRFGLLTTNRETGDPEVSRDGFERGPATKEGKLKMALEVQDQQVVFYVDDEEVGKIERPSSASSGQVGLYTSGEAKFINPRIVY